MREEIGSCEPCKRRWIRHRVERGVKPYMLNFERKELPLNFTLRRMRPWSVPDMIGCQVEGWNLRTCVASFQATLNIWSYAM